MKLDKKENIIDHKIEELCKKVGIDTSTTDERIHLLKKNTLILHALMKYRIKSKIQTYDIRDQDEYNGILNLEKLLLDNQQESVMKLN